MVSDWALVFVLGVRIVAATGGFPPVTGPPGACGLLPADASCATVFLACVKNAQVLSVSPRIGADPYSDDACVAAASCYPGNPDSYLASLTCRLSGPQQPTLQSANIPRVADAVTSKLFGNGNEVTLASYSGWYKDVVNASDPNVTPLIDPAFVKMSYDGILAWTNSCSGGAVQGKNFVDWFTYSSTITGPGGTCNLVSNCPISYYPYVMDLTVTCAKDQTAITNPFGVETCVAAALSWDGGVDSFLQALSCRYALNFNTKPVSRPSNVLAPLSVELTVPGSSPYSQQDFFGFTNNTVFSIGTSAVRSPEINVDHVTLRWEIIAAWTNNCKSGAVPLNQLSDLLKYSHIKLTSTSCTAS